MKKLVCLISALGKSKEQLVEEAWAAVQKFREAEKKKEDDKKIPEGIAKEKSEKM